MKSTPKGLNRREMIRKGSLAAAGMAAMGNPAASRPARDAGPLAGKVALITGAARGIGRATAEELARQGAHVALLDIAEPRGVKHIHGFSLAGEAELDAAVAAVRATGAKALRLKADVRDLPGLHSAAAETVRQLGRLDILVANAGIAIWSPFEQMKPGQWQDVLDVNLTGVANAAWAVIPHLKRQNGGRIIALSSIGGRMGVAGVANYATTKWGVIGLTKSLALELGKYNITVNAVAPTAVNTPMYRSEGQYHSTGMGSFAEQDRAMLAHHPLPVPALEPLDIARSVAFLASGAAGCISGICLDVAAGGNARYTA